MAIFFQKGTFWISSATLSGVAKAWLLSGFARMESDFLSGLLVDNATFTADACPEKQKSPVVSRNHGKIFRNHFRTTGSSKKLLKVFSNRIQELGITVFECGWCQDMNMEGDQTQKKKKRKKKGGAGWGGGRGHHLTLATKESNGSTTSFVTDMMNSSQVVLRIFSRSCIRT